MTLSSDVLEYNASLDAENGRIGSHLAERISHAIAAADCKVWHGHPVWFIDGNPIVGYSLKKSGMQVLFWSGQSLTAAALRPLGKFKAAFLDVPNLETFDEPSFEALLAEAVSVQWNYLGLPKLGRLEKLTNF